MSADGSARPEETGHQNWEKCVLTQVMSRVSHQTKRKLKTIPGYHFHMFGN